MEKEGKDKEPIGPYKKNKDIVISQNQLKKIAIGLLALIGIFFAVMYFNSGLSHKKAKEVFLDNWKSKQEVFDVKIDGIKKLKEDTYWVKISYKLWEERSFDIEGKAVLPWDADKEGVTKKFVYVPYHYNYIYTKWDTGWFIEKKKK